MASGMMGLHSPVTVAGAARHSQPLPFSVPEGTTHDVAWRLVDALRKDKFSSFGM